jgi:tetraacyldisaccharide 4'-kinase
MKIPRPVAILLRPVSKVYERIVGWRNAQFENGSRKAKRLRATVISVGNLTVGGTGKTPMVLWLAEKLLAEGKNVAVLSRGYRGAAGTSDEVDLLRHRLGDRVKFGVGADRYEAGSRLESQNHIDVFILDDGFQHRQLARDLDILMLDGSRKLQNEWVLPSGPLREPISAVKRADILIVSRKFEKPWVEANDADNFSIFYAQTRLLGLRLYRAKTELSYVSEIKDHRVLAFCGIGNPDSFFQDLQRWHVSVVGRRVYRDHHKYSSADVRAIERTAESVQATALITTEKDAQNISGTFRMPVWVAVIDLVFTAESELTATIERILDSRRGAAA